MIFYNWSKQYSITFGIEYSSREITIYKSKKDKAILQW